MSPEPVLFSSHRLCMYSARYPDSHAQPGFLSSRLLHFQKSGLLYPTDQNTSYRQWLHNSRHHTSFHSLHSGNFRKGLQISFLLQHLPDIHKFPGQTPLPFHLHLQMEDLRKRLMLSMTLNAENAGYSFHNSGNKSHRILLCKWQSSLYFHTHTLRSHAPAPLLLCSYLLLQFLSALPGFHRIALSRLLSPDNHFAYSPVHKWRCLHPVPRTGTYADQIQIPAPV